MKISKLMLLLLMVVLISSCSNNSKSASKQPIYNDVPYQQDYAIKYYFQQRNLIPQKVNSDRNGVIQVLASNKLYRAHNGQFQYPGKLVIDKSYQPLTDIKVSSFVTYQNQFVYLDKDFVLSNAWAGKLLINHKIPKAKIICGGNNFDFMISDSKILSYIIDNESIWHGKLVNENILEVKYDEAKNLFFILGEKTLNTFSKKTNKLNQIYSSNNLTSFEIVQREQGLIIGTNDGYLRIDYKGKLVSEKDSKLPWPELTSIKNIDNNIWFGSTKGAFMLRKDGKFNYYHGERWLPGNNVVDISSGPNGSILILTNNGIGQICFEDMTLEDKALRFEEQVRKRHIRYGINANVTQIQNGDLSTNVLSKADSDNLWTSMYLGSQLFRYLVTNSEEAKQNCYESFEAMERLHTINDSLGLFGRTFERRGYQEFHNEYRTYVEDYWYPGYNNVTSWYHADENWDWRGSASSDQTVGQIFAMTLIAEYIDDVEWKNRAIKILDDLMTYIVKNDYCIIDYDGRPSLWGRWSPEYVNRFGTMIGDRKIYSSNLIAFLQSAYKHTGKEIYKEKSFELMKEHGYLENLMRPFSEIGVAPPEADNWSKMLSEEWNHSDDEMYFLAYWALYPYSYNDTLKEQFRVAIKDHWEWERPEKNALWNFCYAMTGAKDFDLDESIWHLKEWPLDMIEFEVRNSHRKDITLVEKNFWGQITSEILPPDERPELKHNRNLFTLDNGVRHTHDYSLSPSSNNEAPWDASEGLSSSQFELSAGDTYLLPYWMGRFLGVISEPKRK